ncbi:LysR family transcriptional regulator [Streptomyces sp. NBC_01565]|uniref:LysR substrate-binding domain-containing protein n=1 Tax=unclassified Streptomyces TaxID=2593676 RepID=UPI0022549C9D|nr:LysR family transcriptional regulator [Streptomyces sp. NBC_01565]MCX4546300.1 LysR substrate-binding domain-containing protein [Streptomyces sp. NBC_01565]
MELRQVRYFAAVAEELHFGRAAERLHIGQPTVSQQIRRLEREFGSELFDRTTRTVTLTHAGQAFLPYARALLDAERAASEAMTGLRTGQDATLRLGTSAGLGRRLERMLCDLVERAPELLVELVSVPLATRLRRVRDGELDAALVRGAESRPGLEVLPLWEEELVAALPGCHPLAAEAEVAPADLAGLPLRIATHEANPPLVDAVTAACRAAGFEPLLGPPFTNDQDTLAAIAAGRPAWTVYYAAQAEVQPAPGVAFRPFTAPAPTVATSLAVRPGPPSRKLAALLDALRGLGADGRR